MRAKLINEKFEEKTDPIEDINIGLWKKYKNLPIPLNEFRENGILKKGRELYNYGATPIGYWLSYDENQNIDLMYGEGYKSKHAPPYACVLVPSKVMYI